MAQSFEEMSDLDKGIYFRQACDAAHEHGSLAANRVTIAHFFTIYGVEAPRDVVNSAMEAVDYLNIGIPRPVEGPRTNTAEYFSRTN